MTSSGFPVPADGVWTQDLLWRADEEGIRLKFVFFWGHAPNHDRTVGPHVFSQWYPQPFVVDGCVYSTAEHFMMVEKARLFGDHQGAAQILAAASPGEAKAIGRAVAGFREQTWEHHRFDIVVRGSTAKFASSPALRDYMMGTGKRVLVEASPTDRIWGIGLAKNDPAATRPSEWPGQNLLGYALMQARATLVREFGSTLY